MANPKNTSTQTGAPASGAKASAPQDAVKLLTDDHGQVKTLFEKYQKLVDANAASQERQPVAEQICDMLTVHTTIEEEIFYPAAREALDDEDLIDEAEVEHAAAKDLIAQIKSMSADDDLYDAKVTVLGEQIDHHVKEEETELFPQCKKSSMDLAALGAQLDTRKSELMEELGESAK